MSDGGPRITSRIVGTGAAFPERVVDNDELCRMLSKEPGVVPDGFGPQWIEDRTGVRKRHFATPGRRDETNRGLATRAARAALEMAQVQPGEIDGILYGTCTPDFLIPASACFLQETLGTRGFALDLNAACSGFQHGLSLGHAMISSGQARKLLIIGSDLLTPVTNFRDRKSCILFGDGAGAAVLAAEPRESGRGILSTIMHSEGASWDLFHVESGGTDSPITNPEQQYESMRMSMKGNEIFRLSVRTMVNLSERVAAACGENLSDVKWVIPHQANLRILEAVARRLDLPFDRVVVNLRERGNTSAATVPTALDTAVRDGRLRSGDLCLINVFGAGITAGATLMRW